MKLAFSSLTQFCLYLGILVAALGHSYISHAQVVSDSTTGTRVNQNGEVAEITGGETRGSNLFHSFQDFSVGSGGEAFFDNAQNIDNILSRVTGGNVSNINGAIRANGSANLFLINPAGIIFGDGASLDLGGSFYGSSASSILFEEGEFSAADIDNPPLLTVNAPIGLGFRDNSGDINLRSGSQLEISPNETLALVGGNITSDGGIIFPRDLRQVGSTFELGGLTEAGTLDIDVNGRLNFPDNVTRGDVSLINNSLINAFSEGGGEVFINARNFALNSNARITNGIFPATSESATTQSGDIFINATEDIVIDGADSELVGINNDVVTTGSGQAGQIVISGRNISLVNGGNISSIVTVTPEGRSSNVTLTAQENILFRGASGISSSGISNLILADQSNSGEINITANNFTIESGALIDASAIGIGTSSNININVNDTVLIDGRSSRIETSLGEFASDLLGTGSSGDINLQTTNLVISNDGIISTSIAGQGEGGNLIIDADNISLDGADSEISSETSLILPNEEVDQANAGNIIINTNSLAVTNAAELSSSSNSVGDAGDISIIARDSVLVSGAGESEFGLPSFISSDVNLAFFSDVVGNSGNVEIETPQLTVSNGAFISASTLAEGDAGNLSIRASEFVEVNNDAFIQTDAFFDATGRGGNLNIETPRLTVSNGGQVSASTFGDGDAGNLTIRASDSINVIGESETQKSGLFANALNLDGQGGELDIFTSDLNVMSGGIISVGNLPDATSTRDPGTGEAGDLNIQANSINIESGGSIENATQSPIGEGGNISLQVAEDIILRDSGLISAEAVGEGNGGNLNIDTNFIVAFPNGNNDIIASAAQGQGGNININAEAVLGIQERPLSNSTNDINASSEVLGLDGSINIETLDFNPLQGLIEIVTGIVEPEQTTAQACRANREDIAKQGNSLTIKGQGGIVPAPDLPLNSHNALINGKTDAPIYSKTQSVFTSLGNIVPARGVKVAKNGQVRLTAHVVNNNQRRYQGSRNCGVLY